MTREEKIQKVIDALISKSPFLKSMPIHDFRSLPIIYCHFCEAAAITYDAEELTHSETCPYLLAKELKNEL